MESFFSQLLRKPVIALSYHQKMDVAMQGIGQGRFSADIERFDVDWLTNAFRSLVDESNSIQVGIWCSGREACGHIVGAVR